MRTYPSLSRASELEPNVIGECPKLMPKKCPNCGEPYTMNDFGEIEECCSVWLSDKPLEHGEVY